MRLRVQGGLHRRQRRDVSELRPWLSRLSLSHTHDNHLVLHSSNITLDTVMSAYSHIQYDSAKWKPC